MKSVLKTIPEYDSKSKQTRSADGLRIFIIASYLSFSKMYLDDCHFLWNHLFVVYDLRKYHEIFKVCTTREKSS